MKLLLSSILLILFATQDDFTFVNENQKVVLKMDNGTKTLLDSADLQSVQA